MHYWHRARGLSAIRRSHGCPYHRAQKNPLIYYSCGFCSELNVTRNVKKGERQILFWLHLGRSAWLISVEGLPSPEVQIPTPPKAVKDNGAVTTLTSLLHSCYPKEGTTTKNRLWTSELSVMWVVLNYVCNLMVRLNFQLNEVCSFSHGCSHWTKWGEELLLTFFSL